MAKRNDPIITNTEILARAIRSVDEELRELEEKASSLPADMRHQWMEPQAKPLRAKREALNMLYCIETGMDYD